MNAGAATIVIVDDAAEVRLLVKTRLRLSGKVTVVAEGADGTQAVALAREHRPSLMLLDVSMPVMDGFEALPQVLAASPSTKVVLYSGFDEEGLAQRARELGAAAFLEKSTSIDVLVDDLLAVLDPFSTPLADGPADLDPVPDDRPTASASDQQVLDEHLERFREVFEEAAIGMATMTLSGRLVRVNHTLADLLLRPGETLVGTPYADLTGGRGALVSAALEAIHERGQDVVQVEHDVPDATPPRRVVATLAPVRDSGGRPLYVFLQVQDVTATRAAELELKRSEERFRLLVEAVEDYAIFMLSTDGTVISWNVGAQRNQGYTAEEILGQHFRVFYPPERQAERHPEHELEIALREGHYEEEGWRVRKDGSRFWANVVITTVYDSEGTHVGFAKVTRDITERRRLAEEREHAAEALAGANDELGAVNDRLRRIADDQSEFLAVTAHELRTPVGVLGGSAEMLAKHWADLSEEERGEILHGMTTSARRLRRLLGDLLTASRLERRALQLHPDHVNVGEVIESTVATIRRTQPDVEILVDGARDVKVRADRDRLAQSLDNLIGNALRHGASPVQVSVRPASAMVEIRVSDFGPGVTAEMQPRLFKRFATGDSRGGGTGLGLFIVRELARAQGGDASYEPGSLEQPAGAFLISLPRVTDPA